MTLAKYLKINDITYRAFAKEVKVSHAAIFRYANRQATPSLKVALKINKITKGKVSVDSLCCK